MRLGIQIPDFTFPGGKETLGKDLAAIARTADDAGFSAIAVMDHFFQIGPVGPPDMDMLEAYTTLGFLAAHTSRAQLLTLVTGAIYREPALLAKTLSTLDVLSGGRAVLGIGAAWNEEESTGLGFRFPPVAERFERLEEVLQICRQMFDGTDAPYSGKHFTLGRTLNVPSPLSALPILIGGGGEKKTLRLVAQYAQMCNLFPGPDLAHKLEVLRGHCEAVGRDYGEIDKTVYYAYDTSKPTAQLVDELGVLKSLGFDMAIGGVKDVSTLAPLELIASEVMPQVV
ncbi:MAG: putative F420-dependent oxidoreductase [Frankiales bacterium]|nr:putative F420-dependent oxidoreductase [Frankiales bacterium]